MKIGGVIDINENEYTQIPLFFFYVANPTNAGLFSVNM